MKRYLLFLFLFTLTAVAEVAPENVEAMLQQMVRENVISEVEAQKAKLRMKSMTPEQWSQINKQAASVAARAPASLVPSNNRIEEVNSIDLDGAQFKEIQKEIKKIVPEYRD